MTAEPPWSLGQALSHVKDEWETTCRDEVHPGILVAGLQKSRRTPPIHPPVCSIRTQSQSHAVWRRRKSHRRARALECACSHSLSIALVVIFLWRGAANWKGPSGCYRSASTKSKSSPSRKSRQKGGATLFILVRNLQPSTLGMLRAFRRWLVGFLRHPPNW